MSPRTQGDGQGVGHIRRLGRLGNWQKNDWIARCICSLLAWPLPVRLFFTFVAGMCRTAGPPAGPPGQHAAGMAHQDGRARVLVVGVKLLDGDAVGLQPRPAVPPGRCKRGDALGEVCLGLGPQRAGLDDPALAALHISTRP